MNTEDKTITPTDAIWLLNNLSTQSPLGVSPAAWVNHRRRIVAKLQRIIDGAQREADYRKLERQYP